MKLFIIRSHNLVYWHCPNIKTIMIISTIKHITLLININLFIATGRIPHLGADIGPFQILGLVLQINIGHINQIRLIAIATVNWFRFQRARLGKNKYLKL